MKVLNLHYYGEPLIMPRLLIMIADLMNEEVAFEHRNITADFGNREAFLAVAAGEYDVIADAWAVDADRSQMVDFSYPISSTDPVFVIPSLKTTTFGRMSRVFRVFSPELWLSIGGIFGCLVVFTRVRHYLAVTPSSVRYTVWSLFEHWLNQNAHPITTHIESLSALPMHVTLGFLSISTLTLYQGYLLGQLVRPLPAGITISSLDELIVLLETRTDVQVNLGFQPQDIYPTELWTSPDPNIVRLRKAVKKAHHYYYFDPTAKHPDKVEIQIQWRMLAYALPLECGNQLVEAAGFTNFPIAFPFYKRSNSTLIDRFNDALFRAFAKVQQEFDYLDEEYDFNNKVCSSRSTTQGNPLGLGLMSGAFVIHCLGTVSAVACCVIEFGRRRLKESLN